jgi:hypothetical protein
MKGQLILFNAASVLAVLIWLGCQLLKGFGRAIGSLDSSSGPGDVNLVYTLVGVGTAACAVYSFFAPAGGARLIALAPLALILLGHGFISYQESARRERRQRERAARRAIWEKKLSGIPKDYILKGVDLEYSGIKTSFLTRDRESNTLLQIDVGYESEISAFPVGRIDGEFLDTLERLDPRGKWWPRYVDPEGKSLFDRYTVRHRPDQDKNFPLDKYGR